MKAILVESDRSLCLTDVPDPVMAEDEVLIAIRYAALNRADLMQREGDYPPPPGCPPWMGLEISGHIVKIGKEAAEKSPGRWGMRSAPCLAAAGTLNMSACGTIC